MDEPRWVSALFVARPGVYCDLACVSAWDEQRDARKYDGSNPVVAHPPCQRWGRYWSGGPSAKTRRALGDDGGCFVAALNAVRRWGGVLEHPEASHAWRRFGIITPPKRGGWIIAGDGIGWTCCVEQGHYGHRARKATWLYAAGVDSLPSLKWGPSPSRARLDPGFHSAAERRAANGVRPATGRRLTTRENLATPIPFRDLLLSIARSAHETKDAPVLRHVEPWAYNNFDEDISDDD